MNKLYIVCVLCILCINFDINRKYHLHFNASLPN